MLRSCPDSDACYPDTPFVNPLKHPIVILPMRVLDEVRNLPEHQASFRKHIAQMFVADHTSIGTDKPEVTKVVKIDLTQHIANPLDDLQAEIRYSLDKELGPCDD